jgi:hypothetical protein
MMFVFQVVDNDGKFNIADGNNQTMAMKTKCGTVQVAVTYVMVQVCLYEYKTESLKKYGFFKTH